jgi:hypothetical protein
MFAPMNLMEVAESRWQGQNPLVTEANVRSLDLANGAGARTGFVGAEPTFRPVGMYEAGRPPLSSPRVVGEAPNSPRRALLRIFGRD